VPSARLREISGGQMIETGATGRVELWSPAEGEVA